MVARNNTCGQPLPRDTLYANGDLVEVVRLKRRHELYGFRFADVEVRFPDYNWEVEVRVLLDVLTSAAPALRAQDQEKLYQEVAADYQTGNPTKKALYQAMRKDPWLNALQVKYGYAFTCHKAQGGQWKRSY